MGKDSVRWQETLKAVGNDKQFQENLKKLIEKKKPNEEIFHNITSRDVNKYFSGIVKGLTAKVFRTYQATAVVKDYLVEHDNMKGKTANEKLYHAKLANLKPAMMCNHKRTIPKTFEQSLQKKRDTLKKAEKDQACKENPKKLMKKVNSSQPKTETQKKSKDQKNQDTK